MKTLNSEIIQVLEQARGLVAKGWCQRSSARNDFDEFVYWNSPDASKFCSLGAISKAADGVNPVVLGMVYAALHKATGVATIASWNDAVGQTRGDVLAGFDKAIATLKRG